MAPKATASLPSIKLSPISALLKYIIKYLIKFKINNSPIANPDLSVNVF